MLAKIEMVLENQQEMLRTLRHVVGSPEEMMEDVFPKCIDSLEDFNQFNDKLSDVQFRKKMVSTSIYLTSLQ